MKRYIPVFILATFAASSVLVVEAQTQQCNATTRTAIQQALVALGIALDACPDTSVEAPHVDRVVASVTQGQTPLSVTFTAELSGGPALSLEWILDTIGDGQPGVVISASSTQPLPLIFPYTFGTPGTFRMYARAANDTGTDMSDSDTPTIVTTSGGGGDVQLHDCHWPVTDWHADEVIDPLTKEVCQPGHEHGSAPPTWLSNVGVQVIFGGDEATPMENEMKHQSYKGFAFVDDRFNCDNFPNIPNCENNNDGAAHPLDPDISDDQYGYVRVHATSNPMDRSARFHSFEAYFLSRHDTGSPWDLSRWQGWVDTGTGVFPGLHRVSSSIDAQIRPVIGVVDQAGWDAGKRCEQWYKVTNRVIENPSDDPNEHREYGEGWGLDLGWNICGSSTIGQPGEHLTATDMSTWVIVPDSYGPQRRLDVSYFPGRGDPPLDVDFLATQFGIRVSSLSDPLCSGSYSIDGRTYLNKCLSFRIASSLKHIGFSSGNVWQEIFSVRGVRIPN